MHIEAFTMSTDSPSEHSRTSPGTPAKESKPLWRNSFDSKRANVELAYDGLSLPQSTASKLSAFPCSRRSMVGPSKAPQTQQTILEGPKPAPVGAETSKRPSEITRMLSKPLPLSQMPPLTMPNVSLDASSVPITAPKKVSARTEFQNALGELPVYSYKDTNDNRKILYTRRMKASENSAKKLLQQKVLVVGLDLEWKPMSLGKTYNRVSLVQIATENVVHLVQLDGSNKFPPALKTFLEDSTVLKVGAGIEQDVQKLSDDWQVSTQNYLDLCQLARYTDPFWGDCDRRGSMILDGAFGLQTSLPSSTYDDISSSDEDEVLMTPTSPKDPDIAPASPTSNSTKSSPPTAESPSFLVPKPYAEALKTTPLTSLAVSSTYPPAPLSTSLSSTLIEESFLLSVKQNGGLPIALVRLVARYQGKRLDKSCQLSNWAAPLNKKQMEYAANDGCASLDVYNALMRLQAKLIVPQTGNLKNRLNRQSSAPAPATRTEYAGTVYMHKTKSAPLLGPVSAGSSDGGSTSASTSAETLKKAAKVARISHTMEEQRQQTVPDKSLGEKTYYPSPPVTPTLLYHQTSKSHTLPGIPQPISSISQPHPPPSDAPVPSRYSHHNHRSNERLQSMSYPPSQGLPTPPTHIFPGPAANVWAHPPGFSVQFGPLGVDGQFQQHPQLGSHGSSGFPGQNGGIMPAPFPTPNSYHASTLQLQPYTRQWYGLPMMSSSHSTASYQPPPGPSHSHFQQHPPLQDDSRLHAKETAWNPLSKQGVAWTGDGWIPTPIVPPSKS